MNNLNLQYLVNISSRKKYASMIREAFLSLFRDNFKTKKYNDLIILYIQFLNNILINILYVI